MNTSDFTVRSNNGGGFLPILDTDFFSSNEETTEGCAIRVGNIWTNIISSTSGKNTNYKTVTTWWNNTSMDDSKVDGVIYRKKGDEYLCKSLDLSKSRSLIISDIEELKNINNTNVVLLRLGYYKDVKIVGVDYVGFFELKDPIENQAYITTKNNLKFSYKDNGSILVDVFGVKRNDKSCINTNARIIEGLIEFGLPMHFLRGEYYINNINLTTPNYGISTYIGSYNRDTYKDRKAWTIINTNGASLFVNSKADKKTNIDFQHIYVKSRDRLGEFFDNSTGIRERDSICHVKDCIFEDLNSVFVSNGFATEVSFEKVNIIRCRYGIIIKDAANRSYFNEIQFYDTAQCIHVYGVNTVIENIALEGLYTGSDWQEIELFGISVYSGIVKNVYVEPYNTHASQAKFALLVRNYGWPSDGATLRVSQFSFSKEYGNNSYKNIHLRVKIDPGYPSSMAPTIFEDCAPYFKVDYLGKENKLLFINATTNDGKAILNGEFACDKDTPICIQDAKLLNTYYEDKYTLFQVARESNLFDNVISKSISANSDSLSYYNPENKYFCLNKNGQYNIFGNVSITDMGADIKGKVMLAFRYRDKNYNYKFIRIGAIDVVKGKGELAFDLKTPYNNESIQLCYEKIDDNTFLPVNKTLGDATKVSLSIRLID